MSLCTEIQMYGSHSPATSTDLNRPFPPPSTNQMSSGSGLLRYRSAPSSVFGELLCEDFLPVNRPSSPDTDSMFARFLPPENPPSSGGGDRRSGQLPPPPVMYQQRRQHHHQNHQIHSQMAAAAAAAMDSGGIKNFAGGGGGGGGNCPNLVRHSSSPAGLFDQLHVENGYGVMRGIGGYRNGNESRLKRQSSSTAAGLMSQISEIDEESIGGYGLGSWEEQRSRDNQTENGTLNHQLSLPKTSSEMSTIEKFLQFQDSVPCKIRAKRGCATHPRSIAERVRRTRISERMRKLQELVPNMDKQTNTADMLDLAVDYIKDLQKQVKTISDRRANCTCSSSSKQKPYTNSTV